MLNEARERSVREVPKQRSARRSVPQWTAARFEKNVSTLSKKCVNESPSYAARAIDPQYRYLLGPEVGNGLRVPAGVRTPVRDDDDHGIVGLVVPDRAQHVGGNEHGIARPDVDDLVLDLELERAL